MKRMTEGGSCLSFSFSIDATKVPQVLEISTDHKAIVSAAFPNHMISTIDMDAGAINRVLKEGL